MLRFVLLFLFFASFNDANIVKPVPTFEAFTPSGIRVSIPDMKGISAFFLWANVNEELGGKDLGTIMLKTYEPTNGEWTMTDMSVKLNPGDTLYYTFFVIIDGEVHRYELQQYKVTELIGSTTIAPPTTPTPKPTTTERATTTTTTTTPKPTTTAAPETTTAAPKLDDKGCFDEVIAVDMGKEKTTVIQKDFEGNEISKIENADCTKSLVIDLDDGKMKFEHFE